MSGEFRRERQAVLDDLSLPMLFADVGRVQIEETADGGEARLLSVRITARPVLGHAAAAALLCRLLHNARVPAVGIQRVAGGMGLRCEYEGLSVTWRVEILWAMPV